jgi:hypothetical protein
MADGGELDRSLTRVLWELRAYLPDLVIIGGWVPFLFRRYGGFSTWRLDVPFTTEVDVLVDSPLPRVGNASIPQLLRQAGFESEGRTDPAAVWTKAPEVGEKVEFLITHRGTAHQLGRVVPVGDQNGLGAVSLEGLQLLRTHTTLLSVPLGAHAGQHQEADVRVPLLGAYVVNKASTFPRRPSRPGDITNPRRAKDLLYLRDLMAAGDEVVETIEEDLRRMVGSEPSSRSDLRTARNNLALALGPAFGGAISEASEAVVERSGSSPEVAVQDVRGYLTDLLEILGDAL